MTLLVIFPAAEGGDHPWLRLDGEAVVARGASLDTLLVEDDRVVLVAPAEKVAIHFLDLPPGLSMPQAQAAARLQLETMVAEPLSGIHVAVGPGEDGLCCAAVVRTDDMALWLEQVAALGTSPDALIPAPLLLRPASEGWVRHDLDGQLLYRRQGAAFGGEADIGPLLTAQADVDIIDRSAFEAQLFSALADPPVDLLTGIFAKRRVWRPDTSRLRFVAALLIAIVAITLLQQIADLFRYSHAVGRIERETEEVIAQQRSSPGAAARLREADLRDASFGRVSGALFNALRAMPDAEIKNLLYRDGVLDVSLRSAAPDAGAVVQQAVARSNYRVRVGSVRQVDTGYEVPLRIARP